MAQLTTKELSKMEDQLSHEEMLVKKFASFANSTTDPQTKTCCQQLQQAHQRHYNTLLSALNSGNM